MFGGTLHPYKPSAKTRLILEKIGLAARAMRSRTDRCDLATEMARIDTGLLAMGIPEPYGLSPDPSALALAVERIGEERLQLGLKFAVRYAANFAIGRWVSEPVRSEYAEALRQQRCQVVAAPAWSIAEGGQFQAEIGQTGREVLRLLVSGGESGQCTVPLYVLLALHDDGPAPRLSIQALPDDETAAHVGNGVVERVKQSLEEVDGRLVLYDLVLDLGLLVGAAVMGALVGAFKRTGLRSFRDWPTEARRQCARQELTEFGTELEALRAHVLAAAQLKAEWNERPGDHLLPEVLPFVCETVNLARRTICYAPLRLARAMRSAGTAVPEDALRDLLGDSWAVEYVWFDHSSICLSVGDFYL